MPARASWSEMALPSAPQPTTATVALLSFSWPGLPIGAKIVWRIYRWRLVCEVTVIDIFFTVAGVESGEWSSVSPYPYGTFRPVGRLLRAPPRPPIPRLEHDFTQD